KSIEFPPDLEYVGNDSFMYSKFSGNLIINHSLKEIGNRAFYSSEFEKVINNSKDLMIQSQSIRLENNTYYTL
ncbi:leucine-rich repeat protein, partial [Escherichia coli]|uniref:leucine-rich repeat protein n=2 Tax=Bacteria TaxID=2 RepID=UPI003CF84932